MFDTAEDVFGNAVRADAPSCAEAFAGRSQEVFAQARSQVSAPVRQLLAAVQLVVAQSPSSLPEPQALADTAALLQAAEQLHAAVLGRVADVDVRKLHTLDGAPSTGTWIAQQQTSLDRGEVALARRLSGLPTLQQAVRSGRLSVAVAERVGKALSKLRRHVDRPDGLIGGQACEEVLVGVIGHGVRNQVCEAFGGLADDDPRLVTLIDELAVIVASPTSQLARLEAAFVLLAGHLEPHALPSALGMLVDACLPNELEKKNADGHAQRGFGLRLNADGTGWHITDGDLDLETGELLHTALQAELAVDEQNPSDTAGYEKLRADGWRAGDPLPADSGHTAGPRSLRQKRHDALTRVLRRLLDSGTLGLRDKVAPHVAVTVGVDTLHGAPGALPGVAGSGARLPLSLIRAWWCDSAATRFVLSLGHKVLETSHTQRTLTPHERRAKRIETGGRCQIAGCRCGPGTTLVPHHPDPWWRCGTTSLGDTVLMCTGNHHDLHSGGHTLRLKDGRWLNEHGWVDRPAA